MRMHLANLAGFVCAIIASLWAATESTPEQDAREVLKQQLVADVDIIELDGRRGLRDSAGNFTALGNYRRIISLSSVADGLLLALSEPDRIAAYSPYAAQSPQSYRYAGTKAMTMRMEPEEIIAMDGDLLLAHHLSRPDHTAKLRESGLQVFDLGEMKGMQTLLPNIITVATLLGHGERGARLAHLVRRRMQHIADDVTYRPSAIYVGIHGDKLYGGTRGTSYADVLAAAGLRDLAADEFTGWPAYNSEHLLQLDPEVLVTQIGMGSTLCRHPGLDRMRGCTGEGRIVELPAGLLVSPGLDVVEAAEQLHELVFNPTQ